MKIIRQILVMVAVVIGLSLAQGCANQEEALARRATAWAELLMRIDSLSKDQAVRDLAEFLEPSAGTSARAEEYYTMWTRGETLNKTVAFSVDEVKVGDADGIGNVRYTSIVSLPDGTKKRSLRVRSGDW